MSKTATYALIESQTLATAASSVTFSSITAGYTDLVFVISAITSVGDRTLRFQFNGDTASNYSMTNVLGYSGGPTSQRVSNSSSGYLSSSSDAVNPATYITNIMDYANTTTYKTVLCRDSTSGSSSTAAALVNLWRATPAAITSMTIFPNTGNFSIGSTFKLYGIQAGNA